MTPVARYETEFPVTWTISRKLLNKKIRSKDGVLVGIVDQLEIDVSTWLVKALKVEAARDLMEKLALDEPSVTGGRVVYVDTMDVDRVEDDAIHLKIDAMQLAKLRWQRTTMVP